MVDKHQKMLERAMSKHAIARSVDALGRVCIPKEMRRAVGIEEGELVAIVYTKDGLVIKPWKEENTIATALEKCLEYMENYELAHKDEIEQKIREIQDILKRTPR